MKLFTIGSTKKTAEEFFSLLEQNNVKSVIDIRLKVGALSGFSKKSDLPFFLDRISGISYSEMNQCAPTDELIKDYQNDEITWSEYRREYLKIIKERKILDDFSKKMLNRACLLCFEPEPDHCHRRILAEYLQKNYSDISIIHL